MRNSRWNLSAKRLCDLQGHRWPTQVPCGPLTRTALLIKIGCLCLIGSAAYAPQLVDAQSVCESCEVQIGVGETYHYWATTGSLVLPVSVTWSDNRYELAAFRFTDQQLLPYPGTHRERLMAESVLGGVPLTSLAAIRARPGAGLHRLRIGGQI